VLVRGKKEGKTPSHLNVLIFFSTIGGKREEQGNSIPPLASLVQRWPLASQQLPAGGVFLSGQQ
jgi:hypothetical protein